MWITVNFPDGCYITHYIWLEPLQGEPINAIRDILECEFLEVAQQVCDVLMANALAPGSNTIS